MLTSPTSAGTPAKAAGLVALACLALLLASCGDDDGPAAAGKIAFNDCRTVGTVEQVCDIYTMNADGSGQTRLTNDGGGAPVWLPSP